MSGPLKVWFEREGRLLRLRLDRPKANVLDAELVQRRDRGTLMRLKLAHFPFQKTLEQFDFGFQPSLDQRQIEELATLNFVAEGGNVVLLGPPGVGKTNEQDVWRISKCFLIV